MVLVDKWETEGKITDANCNDIDRYFTLFKKHIYPKSNALIAIVELKRLFQGSMSLEDFTPKLFDSLVFRIYIQKTYVDEST